MRKIAKYMVDKTCARRIKTFSKKHYQMLNDNAIVVSKESEESKQIKQNKH